MVTVIRNDTQGYKSLHNLIGKVEMMSFIDNSYKHNVNVENLLYYVCIIMFYLSVVQ